MSSVWHFGSDEIAIVQLALRLGDQSNHAELFISTHHNTVLNALALLLLCGAELLQALVLHTQKNTPAPAHNTRVQYERRSALLC